MTAMTGTPLAAAAIAQLEGEGVDTVIGTVVNSAGLTLAKAVPIRQTNTFADPGLGASPSWHAFAIDQTGIAFTADVGVVGTSASGSTCPRCASWATAWRGRRPRFSPRTARRSPRVAGEPCDGSRPRSTTPASRRPSGTKSNSCWWRRTAPVAVGAVGPMRPRRRAGARSVHPGGDRVGDGAGIAIEQFHPEYGANQFEISLPPQPPVAAADQLILMRLIVGRAARRHGLGISLSPAPSPVPSDPVRINIFR